MKTTIGTRMARGLGLLLAATLVACGGGTDDGPIVVHSTAVAGDADVGSPLLVLALQGQLLQLEQPALVRVRVAGQVEIAAHYAAVATAGIALSAPVATGEDVKPVALTAAAPAAVPLKYEAWLQLPAGEHAVQARVVLQARDGDGLSTAALGRARVEVEWRIDLEPGS